MDAAPMIPLPATLTMDEASATLAALRAQLVSAPAPVLDASPLVVLDSAAVAVLLDCRRQAAAQGRTLTISGAPDKLVQLARLYGVQALLGL